MNTKKLKQLVLDLAIHGKLVPQDPNDEPASELLKRIQAEKAKSAKGEKSAVSSVDLDEVPFEVPEGWMWTTLGNIGKWQSGSTPSRSNKNYYGGNIPWLKTGDLNDGFITDIPEFITEEALNNTSVKLNPTNSVLIAMYGATIGKVGILTFPATTNQACCACSEYCVEKMFLFYFLIQERAKFIYKAGGGAQPNISKEIIVDTLIPLPPLAEQHRIVAAIEKWFAVIDQLEKNEADLKKSIEQTKKKVLDLAIRGKLVAQNPEDEPAGELLARIRADVETHGRASKSKKSAIPSVDLDEVPFEVPSSWCWTTIEGAFVINPKNDCKDDLLAGFVPMANVGDGFTNMFTYETKQWSAIKKGFTHFKDGDIAVAKISPCMENRKSMVLSGLPNGVGAGTTELNVFRSEMYPLYSLIFFKTDYFIKKCSSTFAGTVGQQRVDKEVLLSIPFPVPPLAEQKRIVEKIEEVMGVLERIEGV